MRISHGKNVSLGYTICAIALLCVLSGCSFSPFAMGGSDDHSGKVTLVLWYRNHSLDDKVLAEASKQFPNIYIKALKIGGNFDSKFRISLAGHTNVPDLVGLNSNIATYFPDEDQFVDLRTLGAGAIQHDYLDWKWSQATAPDGKVIALPIDTGPTALFYRADLFKQAGLPYEPQDVSSKLKTWDDYIQAGQQLQRATNGKAYMFDNISNVYGQILGQGTRRYFDKTNTFIGNQSHVRRAWDYAVKVHQLGLSADATNYFDRVERRDKQWHDCFAIGGRVDEALDQGFRANHGWRLAGRAGTGRSRQ